MQLQNTQTMSINLQTIQITLEFEALGALTSLRFTPSYSASGTQNSILSKQYSENNVNVLRVRTYGMLRFR